MGNIGATELILIFFLLGICLSFIPMIFYLLTLQNTIYEVKDENRKMRPGQVWLTLIPLFGLVWQFVIVNNLADSLKTEFNLRNINVGEDRPGVGIGLAYCILSCCSIIPILGIVMGLAGFVCWIIYWVRVNDFKTKLIQSRPK
jgi:hypothetical protein